MTNGEYVTRIVEQNEDFCIITDEVNETVNIEVSLDWWKKQSNSDKDCISRAEALAEIEALKKIHFDRVVVLNKVSDSISALPSIQPKPKTDVLDKIRAEIKEESRFCPLTEGLERALEIVDKYKAESEDKE